MIDMEINIQVNESLHGGREADPITYMVTEMTLNTAMKKWLNLRLWGYDMTGIHRFAVSVKHVSQCLSFSRQVS